MTWLFHALSRTIGKKQLVALTGFSLCGFLLVHLVGNLLVFAGKDVFNAYACTLEESPLLVPAEIALALLFGVHLVLALLVTLENTRARPHRYATKRWEGGKTLGSATMWITGPLILVFLAIHLLDFRLASREGLTLYDMVVAKFQSVPYSVVYVAAMFAVALHVSHGLQSALRTLGLVHEKYTPLVETSGWLFAAAVALGYSAIPLWVQFILGARS